MEDIRAKFQQVAQAPRQTATLTVPTLGTVTVAGLTGGEWDEYEAGCVVEKGKAKSFKANRARLLRLCVVDDAGKRVFRDEDEAFLANLPAAVSNPIAARAMALCGATEAEGEAIEGN
jgi:hypothetical protein